MMTFGQTAFSRVGDHIVVYLDALLLIFKRYHPGRDYFESVREVFESRHCDSHKPRSELPT